MKSKKNVLVSLSVFIAIVFVLSLFGQKGKPFELPDYSEVIAGTWVGNSFEINNSDLDSNILNDREEISITFIPDGEGRGTYEATLYNPFYPKRTDSWGTVTLSGAYQIKGDSLVVLIRWEDDNYWAGDVFLIHLKIQGTEMRFFSHYGTIGFYQKQ